MTGAVEFRSDAPGLAIVDVRGEHDLSTVPALAEALDRAAAHANALVELIGVRASREAALLGIEHSLPYGSPDRPGA